MTIKLNHSLKPLANFTKKICLRLNKSVPKFYLRENRNFIGFFLVFLEVFLFFWWRNSEQLCVLKNWTLNSKIKITFSNYTFHKKPRQFFSFSFFNRSVRALKCEWNEFFFLIPNFLQIQKIQFSIDLFSL